MTNPYESPASATPGAAETPFWYLLFCKIYGPVWWTGTAIVIASWINIVSPTVGWAGFCLAGAAALGSYFLPSLVGAKPEDHVTLDSRLLKTKGDAYTDAIKRFMAGATLTYDGVAFGFRPDDEIACGIVASSSSVGESDAREIADHAESVLEILKDSSPEFATAVAGKRFRISIVSSMDAYNTELYRVVDGHMESCG